MRPTPAQVIVGLGAAAVLAAGLAASRGAVAGALAGGLAALGLLARWAPTPPLMLAVTAYLSLFPDGLPLREAVGRGPVGPTLLDLLTVAAGLAFAAAHYRHLKADADEPSADELAGLFVGVAAAAIGGTVTFFVVTRLQPDFDRGTLRFARVDFESGRPETLAFLRAVMLAGLLGGGALVAGLALWLARMHRLTPVEARQLLLDTRWLEVRRELARLETWRAAARRPRRKGVGCVVLAAAVVFGGSFVGFLLFLSRVR